MKKMKKGVLFSCLNFLLACAGLCVFSLSFPSWNVPVYAVATVMLAVSAALFELIYAKAKGLKKPVLRTFICGGAFLAFYFGSVFLINNIILQERKSVTASYYAVSILSVLFTVLFVIALRALKKKFFPAALAVLLAAAIGLAPLLAETYNDYKIKHPTRAASPVGFSEYKEEERGLVNKANFYVSPKGNDKNSGTLKKPFKTIERAQAAVRKLDKKGLNGITVAVMAGEYRVKSLEFIKADSGTAGCPVTYCAYGDGEVIINGGITLEPSSFKAVTDSDVLSRLSDDAKENVLCADLKAYGLTKADWGKIYTIGSYNTAAKYDGDWVGDIYSELFINDKRQTLARYPDEGWLKTDKVLHTGCGRESDGALTAVENWDDIRNPDTDVYQISAALTERISSWRTLDDVWMFGFFKYDWADASSPIGEFNAEKRSLSPKFVSTYGTKEDAPYYFFNVFEELTAPGEWYLDRENGILYVYPDSDINTSTIDFSVTTETVIKINADHLTFDGFTVKGTRGDGISGSGNNITVQNCLIKNVAGNALILNGSNNLAFANEITHTGKGGIYLDGGDRETLTAGNSRAENNLIHDWSEIYQTYQPAVTLGGVGNICSHNEIYNSPHEAITYGGNNHIIEYNHIHDVCLLSDDAGAIYAGRRWDFYGTEIRYNLIYNVGSGEHRPCGIYLDDALSGQTVYGNILVNVPSIGLHLGGGRDLTVKNNIVINSEDRAISYDSRARDGVFGGWFTHSSQKNGDMWQLLFDSPWQSEIWQKAYPAMQNFSSDFDNTDSPDFVPNPANSVVSGNIIINSKGSIGDISNDADRFSDISGNILLKTNQADDYFTDYESGDYSLKNVPDGFETIPMEKIGRY